MACTRRPRTAILADIAYYEGALKEAKDSYLALLKTPNERNHFDDNEGSQTLWKRSLDDQQKAIDFLEDKLQKLRGELCGRSSVVTHKNYRQISPTGWNRR